MQYQVDWLIFIVPISLLLFLVGLIPFMRYTGLGRDKSYVVLFASIVAGAIQSFHRAGELGPFLRTGSKFVASNLENILRVVTAGLAIPLLVAFILRLWGRWIGGKATAEEHAPGVAGIHAWFGTSNVTVGLLLILCAWLGHDISPLLSTVIIGVLLAAYPALNMEFPSVGAVAGHTGLSSVPKPPADDLSAEREKILSMLEAGKLTAEESAELLQALGESSRKRSPQVPLTGHQRFMLIGAALVALGFFLPWFVINPGKELDRAIQQTKLSVTTSNQDSDLLQAIRLGAAIPTRTPPPVATSDISISGGDIPRGLGWATLVLALAAAFIPYVATNLDTATARTIRLLCLGLGAFIVVYLLSQSVRFISIGLIVVLAGYTLAIAGALRERRTALA